MKKIRGGGGGGIFFKRFAFPRETLCSLAKPVEFELFTLQLAVVHTARMFTMERFIEFYFELGLKYKEIQSVLSSRYGFGTF